MKTEYVKFSEREMEVVAPLPEQPKIIVSYDKILNDIQMYEIKLAELNEMKVEAEKLKLIR